MSKKPLYPVSNDLAKRIREIICKSVQSPEQDEALQCAQVYLNTTRAMKNQNHVELKFLIGSVEDFAQRVWNQDDVLGDTDSKMWLVLQKLCSDSGIGIFKIEFDGSDSPRNNHKVVLMDNDAGGKDQDMGQIHYLEIKGAISKAQPCIKVGSPDKKVDFINVGVLNERYCLYVHANPDPMYMSLILKSLFNEIKNNDHKYSANIINQILSELQTEGTLERILTINYESEFKKAIQTILELKLGLQNKYSSLISFKEMNSIEININTRTPVNLLWFENAIHGTARQPIPRNVPNINIYLPSAIYNEGSSKLNFLVWYSDSDNQGFMRHASIKEDDALSPRLIRHAKMLVYCENMERQERYTEFLVNAIDQVRSSPRNNTKHSVQQSNLGKKIVELLNDGEIYNNLRAIPQINEFYFRNFGQNMMIRNAFRDVGIIVKCLKMIYDSSS